MSDEYELAWAAGFYDGEGSAGFYSNGSSSRSMRLCASVAQKDLRPLRRFQRALGFGRIGNIAAQSGVSYWRVTSEPDVRRLSQLLWPHLSEPKREQFTRVLSAFDARPVVQRKAQRGVAAHCTECGVLSAAKGLCRKHYQRQWKKGRVS